jgi:hypothetical protein
VDVGKKLDPHEEELNEIIHKLADDLDFEGEFFNIAFDMLKHGDVVKHLAWDLENGVTTIEALPRFRLTAIENKSQIGNYFQEIYKANFYVVNEQALDEEQRAVYDASACIQFALNNKSTYIRDIAGRVTFRVWSQSPINTLLWYLEWKVNTMINDMLWSHRNVPREWHKLDLSMFSPDKYTGTREEKERKALQAAQAAANTYSLNLQARQVDVGIVTDNKTEVGYIEPKSTNYQQPNQKISQINEAISNAMGLPPVSKDTSYASSLMTGSFAILQAISIAKIIKRGMELVIKKHIQVKYGVKFDDLIDKVKIRLRLILEKDKSEVMRQIAIMADTNDFTSSEIRAEWGLLPLTDEDKADIAEMKLLKPKSGGNLATSTIGDVSADAKKTRFTTWPDYPSETTTPQK